MKKIRSPEKKAGIWLDQEVAFIIRMVDEGEPVIEKVKSDVESRIRIPGEEKVSARFGQSYLDDQEKKQKRQRNQREKYFKEIIKLLSDVDYLYILGPGLAKEGLNNAIENDTSLKLKVILSEAADRLTRPQLIARVEDFFHDKLFTQLKRDLKKKELLH
jgi:hypothetical protein